MYEGAPSPVTGYLASIAKAAGFAALARVLYVAVAEQSIAWAPILIGLAFATLAVGAVMAICQNDVKRMLAYSSISHAGFVLVGLSAVPAAGELGQWVVRVAGAAPVVLEMGGGNQAVSSAVFYLIAYSFMALGSFAVLSALGPELQSADSGAGDADAPSPHALSRYGGLARRRPVVALAFAVLLLAQAGAPLTAGFWAKVQVIRAAIDARPCACRLRADRKRFRQNGLFSFCTRGDPLGLCGILLEGSAGGSPLHHPVVASSPLPRRNC